MVDIFSEDIYVYVYVYIYLVGCDIGNKWVVTISNLMLSLNKYRHTWIASRSVVPRI